MSTNNDPTDWQLTVDDQIISGFNRLSGFDIDQEVSKIMGPGRVVRGFNRMRGANGVTFSIECDATSPSKKLLDQLSRDQTEVRIIAEIVRNLGDYEIGQEKALGCATGVLDRQSFDPIDEDAGTITYEVMGFNPIEEYFTE